MKKILSLIFFFALVATAWAAFTAVENFDDYSPTGTDLNTLNGGTDWAGAWTGTAAKWSIETAPAGGQGGNAAKNTAANDDMYRQFSNSTVGTISFRMRLTITNPSDTIAVVLSDSVVALIYVLMSGGGDLQLEGATTETMLTPYSANTWYTVEVEWDDANQPDKFRGRANAGTWTNWITGVGTYNQVNRIRFVSNATGTRDFWIDDIKPPSAASIVPTIVSHNRRRG